MGGIGTLEEACEMITGNWIGLYNKPVGFLNVNGFFDTFFAFLKDAVNAGFMKLVQEFAVYNRQAMMDELVAGMGLHVVSQFTTIHNYIDTEHMILRKGAVSARKGERLIIPINMRDVS